MPNWCNCELEIEGDSSEIQKLLNAAKNPSEDTNEHSDFSLEKLVPTPNEFIIDSSWHMDNWGTKWDIQPEIDDQGQFVALKFDSAWSPPIEAFETISKLYPSLSFKLTFSEEAMDFFGICLYRDGMQEELKTSYSERFYFDISADYSQAKIVEDNVVIPFDMSYLDDPYEINTDKVETKCILSFPPDIDEDDIDEQFGESVNLTSDVDITHEISSKEYEILDFIKENLQQIKTAAAHNNLDSELPINDPTANKKRKI